jgi:transcriptional repressor NrdR
LVVCPSCHSPTRVLESRRGPDGAAVRRRRECSGCGHRFTTFERREPEPLYVVKRDGERQRFDRMKLRAALLGAAHKRPVIASAIEAIVDRVELAALDRGGELSSERIGELCLEELRRLDWGAYLQFAGTLPSISTASAGPQAVPAAAGSVRAAREDARSIPKAVSRRGLDE